MSVQFGIWNTDGRSLHRDALVKALPLLAPYGPDAGNLYLEDCVGILYCGFHTTEQSRHETQPYQTASGQLLHWDGRLDNRKDLAHDLRIAASCPDALLAAAAYEEWGTSAFCKLKGDWALSLWHPKERSLLLAKDPIGTRSLYYLVGGNEVRWGSLLDSLVLLAGRSFPLNEEYLAGCFSFFPAAHLTPFTGIHSVPPSSFVEICQGRLRVTKYWDFDPEKRVRYRRDADYEEHFRFVFTAAVRGRLRSYSPVMSELSGGIDSSSIVCMADRLISEGLAEAPRLDTVSCYDDSEPNWNEKPFFTIVERTRGRTGCHLPADPAASVFPEYNHREFAPLPQWSGTITKSAKRFAAALVSQGNRVVLSGTGGDETLGGVPTPRPELADLLARMDFRHLANRLTVWALAKRKPVHQLLSETVRAFLPFELFGLSTQMSPASWLEQSFTNRYRCVFRGYENRLKLFGPLPSFQENLSTLQLLKREMACSLPSRNPPYEKRYPYLDRDLVEFVYAIPREQLVRPLERRSLMRRALVGLVPPEILNRKRKGFVSRGPVAELSASWPRIVSENQRMITSELGIVNQAAFLRALDDARHGHTIHIVYMVRTLAIEAWLRHLSRWGVAKFLTTGTQLAGCRTTERKEVTV